MPIRRAAATPPQDKASSPAADGEPDAASEEPSSNEEASPAEEAQGDAAANGEAEASPGEAPPGAKDGAGEKDAAAEKDAADAGKKGLKDGFKLEKAKVKKVKRTIPAWATVAAGKKMPVSNYAGTQPKVDDILIEAIKSNDKSGISYKSVMKYIVEKYPSLELHKRKFLIKKALKKQIEKGTIKQLKGKGLSGSFAIGKKSKAKAPTKKIVTSTGVKSESLGDAMPLIITRLCEPKEASYILIKKYVEQHFPHLNVENRPDLLKAALVRAVERGQLERITGKGASGTFQLKRTADKTLTKGGPLEDAITVAITAMNEPKTCSMATLRKHLIDKNKDSTEARVVALLRKTLTKCKMLGWMEQITGNGFNGTYQLSFPYYPSPAILYPDRVIAPPKKKLEVTKRRRTAHSSDEEEEEEEESEEEEEEEEESSEDDEPPPPKKRLQKRPPPKVRRPVPAKKPRRTAKSKARGKKPAAPSKTPPTPAKKPVSPAKKPAAATAAAKKATPATPVKATPVKRAAPAKRLKTPAVKKLTTRGPAPKKSPSKKAEAKTEVKAELSTRKSLRGRN